MARGPSVKVQLNRQNIVRLQLALGDALSAVGQAILDNADPPDQTPYGVGLVRNGGWLTYVGDRKIGGFGLDGRQPRKPRSVPIRGSTESQVIVGYGFPGRFQELGTIHHGAQPFLSPAASRTVPLAASIMAPVMRAHLAAMP